MLSLHLSSYIDRCLIEFPISLKSHFLLLSFLRYDASEFLNHSCLNRYVRQKIRVWKYRDQCKRWPKSFVTDKKNWRRRKYISAIDVLLSFVIINIVVHFYKSDTFDSNQIWDELYQWTNWINIAHLFSDISKHQSRYY